jgi:hypothetical protein
MRYGGSGILGEGESSAARISEPGHAAGSEDRPSWMGPRSGPVQAAVARAVRQHRAFLEIARAVGELEGTLAGVLPVILGAAGVPWGVAYRLEGDVLVRAAADGVPVTLRDSVEALHIPRYPAFIGSRAARGRRAVTSDRVFAATLDSSTATKFEAAGLDFGIAVPMAHRGVVAGVLIVGLSTPDAPDADLLAFLDAVACLLAPGLLLQGRLPEMEDRHSSLPAAARCSQPGRPSTDICAVAHDVAKSLAKTFDREGCELQLAIGSACTAHADEDQVRQAVWQLLINALDAVDARVSSPDLPTLRRWVRLAVDRAADSVVVSVEDSGPGVQPDLRMRIFEPGFTTKTKGRGYGLHLVRQVAVGHGGHIEIGSSSAGGAVFRLVLPANTGRCCGPDLQSNDTLLLSRPVSVSGVVPMSRASSSPALANSEVPANRASSSSPLANSEVPASRASSPTLANSFVAAPGNIEELARRTRPTVNMRTPR